MWRRGTAECVSRDQPTVVIAATHLEQLLELADDVCGSTLLFTTPYVRGSLDDIAQLVGQVILTPHSSAIDSNTRPNRRRWDWEHREDHPFWTSVLIR